MVEATVCGNHKTSGCVRNVCRWEGKSTLHDEQQGTKAQPCNQRSSPSRQVYWSTVSRLHPQMPRV